MTTDLTVANEIARQIGGKCFYMLGTRYKLGTPNSLSFDLRGSKVCNKIEVTLNGADLYDLKFYRQRKVEGVPTSKLVAEKSGIFNDGLHSAIESVTGLCTRLF